MNKQPSLQFYRENDAVKLYSILSPASSVEAFIATSCATQSICNDPKIFGLNYTARLQSTCARTFQIFQDLFIEEEAVVVNILRGGLNFGLREALGEAFGWNRHTTCFMSAQRARDDGNPEDWHITENSYKKVYFPCAATFIIGDVVATGTSLRYGLYELLSSAAEQKVDVKNIFFFTYGGPKAIEILSEIDTRCRQVFKNYQKTILIYLEGCFTCPTLQTPLTIRLTGTDLVRYGSLMAPEFIESQYQNPSYPIERCIIYDAGSRAFWIREYLEDVIGYWKQNIDLAKRGITFHELLKERMPELDATRFEHVDLETISRQQIEALEKLL